MRKHLSISVLMLTATAAAWAQPARGLAWAWVSSATAPAAYQFNPAGGTITVTNTSTGNYIVNIPNLGTTGGIAHVVAYGGSHYCNIWAWAPSGTTQQVGVICRNPAGALANGDFSVLFYKENRAVTQWDDGYLWADQAASASYTPSATYQWNSKGGSNTVVRTSVGRYTATFRAWGPWGTWAAFWSPPTATQTRPGAGCWAGAVVRMSSSMSGATHPAASRSIPCTT